MSIFSKKKPTSTLVFAKDKCRLEEFTINGTLKRPMFKCQQLVGIKAKNEIDKLVSHSRTSLRGDVLVSFYKKANESGAMVYTSTSKRPLILASNATLGYENMAGAGVSRIVLECLGWSEPKLNELMPELHKTARQMRHDDNGDYIITVER